MEIIKGYTKSEIINIVRTVLKYRTARDKYKMGYLDIAEKNGNRDAKFAIYEFWKYEDNYFEVRHTYVDTLQEEKDAEQKQDMLDWELEGRPNAIALLTKEEVEAIMGFRKPKYEYKRLEYSIGEYMMEYMR